MLNSTKANYDSDLDKYYSTNHYLKKANYHKNKEIRKISCEKKKRPTAYRRSDYGLDFNSEGKNGFDVSRSPTVSINSNRGLPARIQKEYIVMCNVTNDNIDTDTEVQQKNKKKEGTKVFSGKENTCEDSGCNIANVNSNGNKSIQMQTSQINYAHSRHNPNQLQDERSLRKANQLRDNSQKNKEKLDLLRDYMQRNVHKQKQEEDEQPSNNQIQGFGSPNLNEPINKMMILSNREKEFTSSIKKNMRKYSGDQYIRKSHKKNDSVSIIKDLQSNNPNNINLTNKEEFSSKIKIFTKKKLVKSGSSENLKSGDKSGITHRQKTSINRMFSKQKRSQPTSIKNHTIDNTTMSLQIIKKTA